MKIRTPLTALVALLAATSSLALATTTQTLRIVSYNTQDDVGGAAGGPSPSTVIPQLATVIEGIGEQKYAADNVLRLPDIVTLQETTSLSTTVNPLLISLNSYYGSTLYAAGAVGTQSGSATFGNGPNSILYNQSTLRLLASTGIGIPHGSSNGEYRQVMRYEFQPLAATGSAGTFYVYVSHMKSGDGSTLVNDPLTVADMRAQEAAIIRNDSATLPANSSILYTGDLNTADTTEDMYQTFLAASSPSGIARGQAVDPLNPTNINIAFDSSSHAGTQTENADSLSYRDDYILMSTNVYNAAPNSLDYLPNSYHAFANNGSTAYHHSVNLPTNTALNDLVGPLDKSDILSALNSTTGSDHLPIIADFTLTLPEPTLLLPLSTLLLLNRKKRLSTNGHE